MRAVRWVAVGVCGIVATSLRADAYARGAAAVRGGYRALGELDPPVLWAWSTGACAVALLAFAWWGARRLLRDGASI